jgi:hypothetical protein
MAEPTTQPPVRYIDPEDPLLGRDNYIWVSRNERAFVTACWIVHVEAAV